MWSFSGADWTLRAKVISLCMGAHMHVTIAAFRSLVSMVGCTGTLISFPFLTVLQTSRAVVGKSRTYITVWFVVVMRNVPYAHKHSRVMFLQDYSTSFTTLLLQRRPSTAASAITCLWLRPLSFLISERVEYSHAAFSIKLR